MTESSEAKPTSGLRSVGRFSRSLAAQEECDKGYLDFLEAFSKHKEGEAPAEEGFHYKEGWKAAKEFIEPKICQACGGTSHEMKTVNSKTLCQECAIEMRDLMNMGCRIGLGGF